jgi:putative hemolysin
MKKIFLIGMAALTISACNQQGAQDANATANDSTATTADAGTFGAKIDEAGAISMDSLVAMVAAGQSRYCQHQGRRKSERSMPGERLLDESPES